MVAAVRSGVWGAVTSRGCGVGAGVGAVAVAAAAVAVGGMLEGAGTGLSGVSWAEAEAGKLEGAGIGMLGVSEAGPRPGPRGPGMRGPVHYVLLEPLHSGVTHQPPTLACVWVCL